VARTNHHYSCHYFQVGIVWQLTVVLSKTRWAGFWVIYIYCIIYLYKLCFSYFCFVLLRCLALNCGIVWQSKIEVLCQTLAMTVNFGHCLVYLFRYCFLEATKVEKVEWRLAPEGSKYPAGFVLAPTRFKPQLCVTCVTCFQLWVNIYGQHLCYAPNSFGMIAGNLIFGDHYSTLWPSMLRCYNLMSLGLRTQGGVWWPSAGICCPAILVFSTFHINPKMNLEKP